MKRRFCSLEKLVLLSLIILFLPTCIDEITIDTPEGAESAIVVQGSLVYGNPTIIEIDISRLFNFKFLSLNTAFASAGWIENDLGQRVDIKRRGDGTFRTAIPLDDPDFEIDFDRIYQIGVLMGDGRTFTSSPEPLHRVPEIDSIGFEIGSQFVPSLLDPELSILDSVAKFSVYTPLQVNAESERRHLKWRYSRTYQVTEFPFPDEQKTCYIESEVGVFAPKSFDPTSGDGDYLSGFEIFRQRPAHHFNEGYVFSLYQESLSEGAFRYWNLIEQLLLRDGNMFEAPAGRLITNISNPDDPKDSVYGYFYATQRDTVRRYISPGFFNNPPMYCPNFIGVEQPPKVCTDCLTGELGSQDTPPEYWDPE